MDFTGKVALVTGGGNGIVVCSPETRLVCKLANWLFRLERSTR